MELAEQFLLLHLLEGVELIQVAVLLSYCLSSQERLCRWSKLGHSQRCHVLPVFNLRYVDVRHVHVLVVLRTVWAQNVQVFDLNVGKCTVLVWT